MKVNLQEDRFLLNSLTKACRLTNDTVYTRLPIHKNFLALLLIEVGRKYDAQPYARFLFLVIFSTMYFGLFRVCKVTLTKSAHHVKVGDVHVGINKKKLMFVLYMSKTHDRGSKLQIIKVSAVNINKCNSEKFYLGSSDQKSKYRHCPFVLLQQYIQIRK